MIRELDASAHAKLLAYTLLSRADKGAQCYPSIATSADDTSSNRSTVKRSFKELAAKNVVRVEQRRDAAGDLTSNMVTILIGVGSEGTDLGSEGTDRRLSESPPVGSVGTEGGFTGNPYLPNVSTQAELTHGTGTATRTRARSTKSPKHSPEHIASKNKIVDCWIACFESKKGVKPVKIDLADHAAAFGLAKTYGDTEGCSIVRRSFEDPFVVEKNSSLKYIASKSETYRGTMARNGRAPVQRQPEGGSIWSIGDES